MSRSEEQDMHSETQPVCRSLERVLSSRVTLAMVLLVAALLRAGHIFQLRPLPLFDTLLLDSAYYDQWAQKIAAGDWLGGERAFYMDPLYPYLLAFIYRCFGHDLLLARMIQGGIGVATCGLVGIMGRRLGGGAVGTVAALLMAIYRPAIYNECEIEKTAVGLFLITAALVFAMRRSAPAAFGTGACLALATLTRGNLIAMVPLAVLYCLSDPGLDSDETRRLPWAMRWPARIKGRHGVNALALFLGCFLIFGPVMWRNHHVSGEWILTTSQAGTNFYMGNNPENASGGYWPLSFVRPSPLYEEGDFRAEAEARLGRPLTPKEVSSYWFHESVKHIRDNPGFALKMFMAKFLLFWSNEELPDGWDINFLKRYSMVLRLPLMSMGWLLPWALLGMIVFFRKSRHTRLLAGFVAIYSSSVILFFLFSRYRLHVVPPLAVLAALGMQWVWQRLREHDLRRLTAGFIVLLTTGAFSFFGVPAVASSHHEWNHNYLDLAQLYEDRGDYRQAQALLTEALQLEPEQPDTLCAIGRIHQKTGNHTDAASFLERCARADGSFQDVWFSLGTSYEALHQLQKAIDCYREQLKVLPGHQPSVERLNALGHRTAAGP